MSGAGHATVREQIGAWALQRGMAEEIRFEHDAEPVLAEGTPAGQGIALIVGTGSAAIGADASGTKHVVGGWGYHYGDEGSAYWIGRRALVAVARSADGRSGPTALVEALTTKLGVADARAILGALEQTGNVRGAIARLAVEVEQAARAGDATALSIVKRGAERTGDDDRYARRTLEDGEPLSAGARRRRDLRQRADAQRTGGGARRPRPAA